MFKVKAVGFMIIGLVVMYLGSLGFAQTVQQNAVFINGDNNTVVQLGVLVDNQVPGDVQVFYNAGS